jgi:hypothetical protein
MGPEIFIPDSRDPLDMEIQGGVWKDQGVQKQVQKYVFWTPEVQKYMEGCTRTRDVQKWVRNYLFWPPETQNAKEFKEECAGTRVSGNKSGNNCSGLRRHRNKWEGT